MKSKLSSVFAFPFTLALLLSACAVPAPPVAVKAPAEAPTALVAQPEVKPTAEGTPAQPAVSLLDGMGSHTRKITTAADMSQKYFDQGLVLTYAFNHEEALKSFQEAARLDPDCAMCYWGVAYVLGPNYNYPMDDAAVPKAYAAIQKALALATPSAATPVEVALIKALAKRYAAEPVQNRSALDQAYSDAMREVAKQFPDDVDVLTLFAESLMDLMPWNLWTKDGQPQPVTEELIATLEAALAKNPSHPGANHYYIHATEPSPHPEKAIPSAERLKSLVPGAGHLVHMPAHTYWRVGQYHDAAEINVHAAHADESMNFVPDRTSRPIYPALYYPHNVHFLYTARMMEGRSADAIEAGRKLEEVVPIEMYRDLPFLEDFAPSHLFALARFGKWDEILTRPQPPAELRYTTGVWRYARGLALLRQGKPDEAQKELDALLALANSKEMQEFGLSSFATAGQLLTIAANTLEGEIAAAKGDLDHAIEHLEAAVKIQDELPYIEPPAWYMPVRQVLGAMLLDAGKSAEAEVVYRDDLKQYPKNGWSLFGLAQSLKAQGKDADAADVQKQFEEAWQHADVTLKRSSF
jgi:tetratricopeptide (TPR) repeat protein